MTVERRRKPLILASNRAILESVFNPVVGAEDGGGDHRRRSWFAYDDSPLRLAAGMLRFSDDGSGGGDEFNEISSFVGVSTSVLRRLGIFTGSLVQIKNPKNNVERIVKAVVLDRLLLHDTKREDPDLTTSTSPFTRVMGVLPTCTYPKPAHFPLDEEVAYVSPLLAFNLGLHVSCIPFICQSGEESSEYLAEGKGHEAAIDGANDFSAHVELVPWLQLPKYASHVQASFVRIPECGVLSSLRGKSTIEERDHQDLIDSALHQYFRVDRFLARGDVFCVRNNWNCHSDLSLICNEEDTKSPSYNMIYFKIIAMGPSDEPILRINSKETAFVLAGGVSSAIPPYDFVVSSRDLTPLQDETVKSLASVLAPTLYPPHISSRFRVSVFLYGPSGCGKRTVVKYVARHLGLHVVEYSCHDLVSSSERRPSDALESIFKEVSRYSPCILMLRQFNVLGSISSAEGPSYSAAMASQVASVIREFTVAHPKDEDVHLANTVDGSLYLAESGRRRHKIILVAAADSSEGLPLPIRRCFTDEISMTSLTEEQRANIISQSIHSFTRITDESITDDFLKSLAAQTSGFKPRDLNALVADAAASFVCRVFPQKNIIKTTECDDNSSTSSMTIQDNSKFDTFGVTRLGKEDLLRALERVKKRIASALGTPNVPNVKWEDVGGLEEVKKSILDTVQLPLIYKHFFSSGIRKRTGVLLYGPPGTGKTLLAKAVATECSLNFLSVKGPELINMYIGESEKNVRDIFQKARSARPCVIFFDELDSLAPARGASGDSGGVMDRVVSQMLAEIDGLNESSQDLFVIGATNRPDLIDPALLRPGRFDKLLFVGVNSDASYRERVLKALTRKFKLHENVSLLSVAKRCPPNFTGADMYALCADAWFYAAKRKVSNHSPDTSNVEDKTDSVIVEFDDFVKVLGEISPSLSLAELEKYERLREKIEGPAR
ncbi:peroxisomal ATPase PEX6 [Typha angustifolia]|uniref:peroxisomal ATPase PEX6 n=1 Tax=Typha angustifolia TaxID=59011 RepID=UPI003C2F81C9